MQANQKVADLIVCGADEKIIRVLEPPAVFLNMLNGLGTGLPQEQLHLFFPQGQEEEYLQPNERGIVEYKMETQGGQQVLGLLTKAVKVEKPKYTNYYDEDEDVDVILQRQQEKQKSDYRSPPNEDFLVKQTLWPELNKLYAHGFELKNVVCSHRGDLVFSSCKGQT